jgi:Fic family protein
MLYRAPELDDREGRVLEEIEGLRKTLRWQLSEPRRWTGSLRRLSFARNIQGSNSIEGFVAGLDDAAAVAAGEEPLDAGEETRLALTGYREAMTYVLQLASDNDFAYSEQLIKSLHFMMTNYAMVNRPGLWRAGSIFVQRDDDGAIVYEGPDVGGVPELMRELAVDMNRDAAEPALVRAAMAHLNLVMIHPFKDGNGRTARCLQSLVLARTGVLSPVFMSIEEYLGRNTQDYYDVLAEVGQGSWHPDSDTRPWVRFTLTAHLRQARTLVTRIRESERLWGELEKLVAGKKVSERSLLALFDAAMGLRVRNSTYRSSLADTPDEISEQTASNDLRKLVVAELLVPKGERRGRHYVASQRLASLMSAIRAERPAKDRSDPFALHP